MNRSNHLIWKLLIVVAFFSSYNLSAQSIWLSEKGDFFAFEFARPSISGASGIKFYSGAYDLSFGKSIGENFQFIGELPFAEFSADNFESEQMIGNLYIGGRFGKPDHAVMGEIGFFLPTASKDKFFAPVMGTYAYLDRFEKYIPESWSVSGRVRIDDTFSNENVFYKIIGGLAYIGLTDSESSANLLFLDYSAQIGYRTPDNVAIRGGISARTGLNDDSKFAKDDSSIFLGGIAASYRSQNFEPGIELKFPLDEPYKEAVSNIFSITLLFHL